MRFRKRLAADLAIPFTSRKIGVPAYAKKKRLSKQEAAREVRYSFLKDVANKGTSVIVNDDFLKFHDRDRRAYFQDEFMEHLKALA